MKMKKILLPTLYNRNYGGIFQWKILSELQKYRFKEKNNLKNVTDGYTKTLAHWLEFSTLTI